MDTVFFLKPIVELCFLLPVVLLEAVIVMYILELPFKQVLRTCFVANILSICVGLIMPVFEFLFDSLGYSALSIFYTLSILLLFAISFLITFLVQRWYYIRIWGKTVEKAYLSKACLFANLAAFLPLTGLMIIFAKVHTERQDMLAYGKKVSCAVNLKQIGLALAQYTSNNNGFFPAGNGGEVFEMLRSQGYLTDWKTYSCPHKKMENAIPNAPITMNAASYLYFGEGISEKDSPDSPIACDKPENHKDYGNVLFVDGHVQGFGGAKWMKDAGISKKLTTTKSQQP